MCLILLLLLRQWFFAGRGWKNFIWQRQWLWLSLGCLSWVLWWNSRIKLFWSQGGSSVGWLNEWINVYSFFVVSWHFVLFLFIQVFKNFMIFLCLRGVSPLYLYFFLLRPYSFFVYFFLFAWDYTICCKHHECTLLPFIFLFPLVIRGNIRDIFYYTWYSKSLL